MRLTWGKLCGNVEFNTVKPAAAMADKTDQEGAGFAGDHEASVEAATRAERIAAAAALTQRSYSMLGIDLDERKADLTPRRVSRRQS